MQIVLGTKATIRELWSNTVPTLNFSLDTEVYNICVHAGTNLFIHLLFYFIFYSFPSYGYALQLYQEYAYAHSGDVYPRF